jgi:hypothetical protein
MATLMNVTSMGGALTALWSATGSALAAVSVLGDAAAHGAQALNNLATVAEETSGAYLDESRARRKSQRLLLEREYQVLEGSPLASAQAVVTEPVPSVIVQ